MKKTKDKIDFILSLYDKDKMRIGTIIYISGGIVTSLICIKFIDRYIGHTCISKVKINREFVQPVSVAGPIISGVVWPVSLPLLMFFDQKWKDDRNLVKKVKKKWNEWF